MPFRHMRSLYVPAGAIRFADKASSAVAYAYTDRRGRPCAVAFAGRAQKPAFHESYQSAARREQRVGAFFAAIRANEARQLARRADRAAWVNPHKPGDIFSTCWGYEQTNREYYQVLAVAGKHLTVQRIACDYVEQQWCAGQVVPLPGQFMGEPFRVRVSEAGFKVGHQRATFDKPELVAGVPTYQPRYVSSYA